MEQHDGASRVTARRVAGELPLLAVCTMLLSSGADILPGDAFLKIGVFQLNAARVIILIGLIAFVYAERPRLATWQTGLAIPIALLSVDNVYRYGLVPRNSFGMAPLSFFLLSCYAAGGWSVLNRTTARRFYQHHPDRYLETQIVLDDTTIAFRNVTVECRLA